MVNEDGTPRLTTRELKSETFEVLKSENFTVRIKPLIELHSSKMIMPLFSASYNPSKNIRWHAISSFGYLTKELTPSHLIKIRDLIRRCIWMLTEESGGIPWMAPAIIGEIIANSDEMAGKFSNILLSYVYEPENGPDNYLGNLQLRKSAYWGIFRLTQIFPKYVLKNKAIIQQRLKREKDPEVLTLLYLIARNISLNDELSGIRRAILNSQPVELYINEKFRIIDLNKDMNKSVEL